MLPITLFPRRFITSNKRVLLAHASRNFKCMAIDIMKVNVRSISRHNATTKNLSPRMSTISFYDKETTTEEESLLCSNWWTGVNPSYDKVPGMLPDQTLTSLPLPHLRPCSKQNVIDYFKNTWCLTEVLFSALKTEETFLIPPYHNLRHPLIFYYGHTAVFYINKLLVAGIIDRGVNEYFERLFEVGVDEMTWDDLSKNTMEWPRIEQVNAYRRQVYDLVHEVILSHPELEGEITKESQLWALLMAMEHERIHLETSSVLIRELPLEYLRKPQYWRSSHPSSRNIRHQPFPKVGIDYPKNEWIQHPGGKVELGKKDDFPSYGWDNEYGQRELTVSPFQGTRYMISNGEYWHFVKDFGYQKQQYWSKEGWEWKAFRNVKSPSFWCPDGPEGSFRYKYRSLFDEISMPWSWPVITNYHEAAAFANWAKEKDSSKRVYHLTTEAIHSLIRDDHGEDDPVMKSKEKMSDYYSVNLNLSYSSSSPVNEYPPNSQGFCDVFGNAWEWCEDHFSALNGFGIHPYYEDFSTPCFDGEHHLIMGGSFLSTGSNGASKFSRFHFRPHFHQHAGFRLFSPLTSQPFLQTSCLDAPGPYAKPNPFRSSIQKEQEHLKNRKTSIAQNLISHYCLEESNPASNDTLQLLNFQQTCAVLTARAFRQYGQTLTQHTRALDMGCSVGRSTFELTKWFNVVVGIDNNSEFIKIANELKDKGILEYLVENDFRGERLTCKIEEGVDRSKVTFKVADAMSMSPSFTHFDAVLIANLIENIAGPSAVLKRMGGHGGIVAPGGLLVLTSCYQWDANITPKESWIKGNTRDDGNSIEYIQGISKCLGEEFELLHQEDIPSWSHVSPRSYLVNVSHAMVWRRRT